MAVRMSLGAALAASIAVGALVIEGSAATPKVDTPVAAADTKFVSKRYGYTIVLDDTYRAKFARKGWTGEFPLMDSGEVDVFTGRGRPERFFIVAAMPMPSKTTLRRFTADHVEVMSGFALCKPARAFRNTRLGGVAAREFTQRCLVHDAFVVTAIRRGRGYTFQYVAEKENPASVDRPVFEAGRRTFRFTS